MTDTVFGGWQSGWFWIAGYEPSAGFATLSRGQVGDVVARITVKVWDGLAEIFFLRHDPARQSIDLLAKIDQEFPWSLECSVRLTERSTERLDQAADRWEPDPDLLFQLMICLNDGLQITTLRDAESEGVVPFDLAAELIEAREWVQRTAFD